MSFVLKLEEMAVFALCVFLFSKLNFAWWWFPALLLIPDIGMIGYLINPKVGALTYNVMHHRLLAAGIAVYAFTSGSENWKLMAIILFAHISFDRIFGYGLKHSDSFSNTHLGIIGKGKKP
ncbi:MAG: DUF4260 domain-containing protein [Bacteroidia bacterium]|nr:DUF4260 domain-containing protein [Bacteroidia bacterium]